MYETQYHRAGSIADAVRLLGEAEDGKFLAGGQTLLPTMKQRLAAPTDLIDLRHVPELQGITVENGTVRIGAAVPHAAVAASDALRAVCPGICHLASEIGDPHVRNMGTLGGSVANNDPAADYPAALLALDAVIHTDQRELNAEDFFTGLFETALEEGELITAISFAAPERSAYAKFPNPASRYPVAGVFVAKTGNTVRVAVTGAGEDGVFRLEEAEAALQADFSAQALDRLEADPDLMLSDFHADAEYRAHLVMVMARRAVAAA